MRKPHTIPPQVRALQRRVSNPDISAWVAANAGSGKTHVLVQRVINLLLDGVDPEKILCITFTKAAAANMAKRVFDKLAAWTMLDDAALDDAIREESLTPPDPPRRALARKLFARALETPGGLKVQTIHAFCTQLLHRFPFEANVVARFTVLDEAEHTQLLEQLTLAVLLQGAAAPDGALGRALAAAMIAAADQTFRDVVREAIGQRDSIARWVDNSDLDAAIGRLSKALGADPDLAKADIEDQIVNGPILPQSDWANIAAICNESSARDQEQCGRLTLASRVTGSERVDAYLKVFIDTKSQPRGSLLTKPLAKKHPELALRLIDEQSRVLRLRELRNAVICRDRSAALLTIAYEVLSRYRREKDRCGLLDYDDLIDKALELLGNVDAAWVHYKLDLGIDHLLIDEAQDTSRKQWEIVRRLVAEFAAGAGARTVKRTIFAVGDEKQSIYSFQDAAPKEFADIGRAFQRAHTDAQLEFIFCELKHSFRSGANILAAVDEVFKGPAMTASVAAVEGEIPPHIALDDTPPGVVEIWEPEKPDPPREVEPWQAPFDTVSETSPRVKLAQRIARTVRRIVDGREAVGMDRRAARFGDILVLVRQRGPLFEAIIRALKNENVDVAGADRLVLTEHIAVMDLMTLADALLLPQDDLALATVLRSPLFGLADEDLFAIAWNRHPLSLRAALARKTGESENFAAAAARLDELAKAVRHEMPFSFFAGVLGAGGGRKRFLARLGPEANDALDEFLNLALDYERREAPSLQGFVAWLRDARAEVRRDMEIARDEVRVMTVHGAKGLEAPIVILADTMTPPAGPRPPRLLELSGGGVIWTGRSADDVPSVSDARNAARTEAENEYRRLLYVAMTRAADRLIVAGADSGRARPKGCWYDLVRAPLETSLVKEDDNGETVFRYRKVPSALARAAAASDETVIRPAPPPWLRQNAPAEPSRPITLSPSAAIDEEIGGIAHRAGSAADRQKALQRGRLVHRLMQSLPDIPKERRNDAAERFLANAAADFSPAERAEMVKKILTILDDEDFAEIFAPGSHAEVPIVGQMRRENAGLIRVPGQVDRLAVTDKAVLIIDYKTDWIVPRRLEQVPSPYVGQLAAYHALLSRIYPDKTIRAALVFTEEPRLVEIPASAMSAALSAHIQRLTPR